MKLRRRSLGNIRFIGELYKIKMLNGRTMHECIRKLLVQTDEESLECLCRLVTTVGALLEEETNTIKQIHEEAKKEELRVTLANMTPDPPPSRRSEDRSDRRRSQMGRDSRGNKDARSDRGRRDQDWNNVPSKAAKIQEKVDPSKLK